MDNIIKILLLLIFCIGSGTMAFNSNSTMNHLIMEIEDNRMLGMDCSIYSNSIESIIIEYKQMYDSLNIACQLHIKSTVEKLKSTVDKMVDEKLDEYLTSINAMRSKVLEIKQYSYLQSVTKLDEKYQSDLGSLQENFTITLNEKNSIIEFMKQSENTLAQSVGKCQSDVKLLEANLTQTIIEKNQILTEQNKTSIVSRIRNGDFELGRELFLKSNELDRTELINSVYDKNIVYAEKVITFLNSFSDNESIILGYRLLFDLMTKNQHMFSAPTTTIAYRVLGDFKQTYANNQNMMYLLSNLPDSLKNYPWSETAVIRNVKFNKKIYIQEHSGFHHDTLRNIPFIFTESLSNAAYEQLNIIPMSNGTYFHIKVTQYQEYLFADTNDFAWDNDRRAVFSWLKRNEIKNEGGWKLEPIQDTQYFKIKNIFWNEYLSVAEGLIISSTYKYNKLFTLRSGKCEDDYCKWSFSRY